MNTTQQTEMNFAEMTASAVADADKNGDCLRCERCGNKVDPVNAVWLEMSTTKGIYLTAGKRAAEGDSQGWFLFGPDCAKRPNTKKPGFSN